MKKHKNGFTLAEVLITLVIIGIIAAMTIPTLMNKTNEQETVVAVKKAYSVLGQAYQRIVAENGEISPQNLGSTVDEATKNLGDMFAKELNVQKNCQQDSGEDCWATDNGGEYKLFNGNKWFNFNQNPDKYYQMRLSDGSSFSLSVAGTDYLQYGTSEALKYSYAVFSIDVNGDKGPNTDGKDVFSFILTKYGIIPCGTPYDTKYTLQSCRYNGAGCTAWVITKGNMDYLKKEVSW